MTDFWRPELQTLRREELRALQEELTATEDKIAFARRYYNGSVRDYNIALQSFPRNLIASSLGFRAVPFFQADEGDRAAPQVSFGGSQSS